MRKFLLYLTLLMALALVLAACGNGDGDEGGTDNEDSAVARGEALYRQSTIGSNNAPGCVTCHSLEPGVVLVGPSHADVGLRSASAVAGMTAEEYIHESIINPNAHIVEGFAEGVMYQNYGDDLTEQEISDLVAFLLTQTE